MLDALLIYPRLGSMDTMVVDLPLSIIYAAAESVKRGYRIKAVDLRVENGDWRDALRPHFQEGVRLAGVSVMTGQPLKNAREVSIFIKANFPEVKIVWGGPHATILPETIEEPYLDFLVRGYGSKTLADLIQYLQTPDGPPHHIDGISYKIGTERFHTPRSRDHEIIPYQELPYHLVDVRSPRYVRAYSNTRMFPIFSSIGCPYRCAFCVHPAIYREINGSKWRPYPDEEIVGHIKYVKEQYNADHIVFMDDTSFPDLARMQRLFTKIVDSNLGVTLEFRGARVNEIDRMDDAFLQLMIKAGTRVMQVGAESGCDKILKSFDKAITSDQILRVNRKLAKYPQIMTHYNFIYGVPGETYEDLLVTKNLVLQLLRDNPSAYFGFGGDWKPIPGTRTLELAVKEYGYRAPKTMGEWIEVDSSDAQKKICHPWYTRQHNDLIKLMQVSSFVIDNKVVRESSQNRTPLFRLIRLLARIYKPIAFFRLKSNFSRYMIEHDLWRLFVRFLSQLRRGINQNEK